MIICKSLGRVWSCVSIFISWADPICFIVCTFCVIRLPLPSPPPPVWLLFFSFFCCCDHCHDLLLLLLDQVTPHLPIFCCYFQLTSQPLWNINFCLYFSFLCVFMNFLLFLLHCGLQSKNFPIALLISFLSVCPIKRRCLFLTAWFSRNCLFLSISSTWVILSYNFSLCTVLRFSVCDLCQEMWALMEVTRMVGWNIFTLMGWIHSL